MKDHLNLVKFLLQVGDLKARMEVNNQIDAKIKQMEAFQDKFKQFETVLKVGLLFNGI